MAVARSVAGGVVARAGGVWCLQQRRVAFIIYSGNCGGSSIDWQRRAKAHCC